MTGPSAITRGATQRVLDPPETFERTPTRLVSGRLLTWYGPAMVQAHRELR
ncbi:hypothetical protein [Janibacter melonis]|uniref:hypothetical protein n=1 Tax=Janibacter melonis TaxID=262209 RepID=UPI0027E256DA|nr:hypothetical protein [Janibacter melonis]